MPVDGTTKRPNARSSNGKISGRKKPAAGRQLTAQGEVGRIIGFASEPNGEPKVAGIRLASGLSQDEFARLTGYSTRAVAGWEAGKPVARAARRRFAEIDRLLKALAELMRPGSIGRWLRQPNEAFEGQTPMQVVERGEGDRLWQMIYQVDANVAN